MRKNNILSEQEKYAQQWESSGQFFYENNSYKHLSSQIAGHPTVLEIGCGTGQSTLELLQDRHTVIAVEHNPYCLSKAKELVRAEGFNVCESIEELTNNSVFFIEYDVTQPEFVERILPNCTIDVVVCWNVGTYWNKDMMNDTLPKMLQYGLTVEQIRANPESSYGELIIWTACSIARERNCTVHIVDRSIERITRLNNQYYELLKKEFGFAKVKYQNLKGKALSVGGRILSIKGKPAFQKELPIFFISALMK